MSRRKVTLVSGRSPIEQGELASSSPEGVMKSEDYSDEEEQQEEDVEEQHDSEHDIDYGEDDQDGLEIKPPPVPVKKKDKHKHKRNKEEKKKDKSKSKHKEEDKDRHREVRGRDREVQRDHREDRERGMPDRYSTDAKAFDRKQSSKDRERELKEKLMREQEKREKSRLERERLERLEREKTRERRMREDRERRELEKRRKKEEERKLHIMKKQREEERTRKERAKMHHSSSRGRSRSPERRSDSRSVKSRLGPRVSGRGRGDRSPEARHSDSKSYSPAGQRNVRYPKDGIPDTAQSPSEDESEDSESDSGSGTESSSAEETSGDEHKQEEGEDDHEDHEDKKHLAKSKFDDHSDNESEAGSAGIDAHNDQDGFLQDTPPLSPIELKPELPPYFPAIQGCRSVEEFKCLNRIEEGTYGVVYRAQDKKREEIVALKRLKMEKEKEGFPITSLREINTLLKAQHTNIVTVREIVVGSNMDKIYIVMDYVEHDLKSLMETMKQPFLMGEVKTLLKQLIRGVQHLHDNWIIHRDLKTSNLLLSHKGILKIGDFGLAREYGEPLKHYTPIVVTLWYRAPELLLGTKEYSTPIDMWSVGCIMAEFLTMKAIWQGKSEIDQLQKIFKDLGTPNEKIWPGVMELPGMKKCTFTEYPYNTLRNKFGGYLSDCGFGLLNKFLAYSPSRRITAGEAINHEFFTEAPTPVDPSMFPTWPAKSEQPRTGKHLSSPKPPSGGKAYSKLIDDGDDAIAGFHLTNAAKGVSAVGPGFSLKF